MFSIIFFVLGLAFALSPWASPPLALVAGIAFGLTLAHPWPAASKRLSKTLLQASVVSLGFSMNLFAVLKAGSTGICLTALSISAALACGLLLGRALRVGERSAYLISVGTAICGGSAIAAVGPILGAEEEEMSVSLGTVFLLNSVALLAFPAIGAALGLSQNQFGLWSALAIHDTSSVVGAAAKYGSGALAIATTVKLARALWIVPVSLATAALKRSGARVHWPWFILFFCLAAALNTLSPVGTSLFSALARAGRLGLTATLFLIGSGISLSSLKRVGARPLLQGLLLWALVAAGSLALIR